MGTAPIVNVIENPKSRKIILILCGVIFLLFLIMGFGAWFAHNKFTQADMTMVKKEVEIQMLKKQLIESSKGYAPLYAKNDSLEKRNTELEKKKQKNNQTYVENKKMLDTLSATGQGNFLSTRLDSARKAGW